MSTIANNWKRIELWLTTNAPEALEYLKGPATEDAIGRAEAKLRLKLPDDVRASLLVHDGSANPTSDYGIAEGFVLYSLDKVIKTRELMHRLRASGDIPASLDREAEPDPGVRPVWWHDNWIPVAANTSRVLVCVDLDPAPGGSFGQLVLYISDTSDRKVIAPSFAAWLERIATRLESGTIVARRDDTGELEAIGGWHPDEETDDETDDDSP